MGKAMGTQVEPLISLRHASRESGIAYGILRRLVDQERVPSIVVGGVPRIRLSDLLASMHERGGSGSRPKPPTATAKSEG